MISQERLSFLGYALEYSLLVSNLTQYFDLLNILIKELEQEEGIYINQNLEFKNKIDNSDQLFHILKIFTFNPELTTHIYLKESLEQNYNYVKNKINKN